MYPHGYYQYFHEILTEMDTGKINIQKRLYIIRNYILFSYLINKHVIKINGMSLINKFLIILMWIAGYIKSYEYKKKNTI